MSGARNPKETRFSIGVSKTIDDRLNRLADVSGQNKGTMAAFAIAAGLIKLEDAFLGPMANVPPELAARMAEAVKEKQQQDLNEIGALVDAAQEKRAA